LAGGTPPKAPAGWRSPRRSARDVSVEGRGSVLDGGGPPPLWAGNCRAGCVFNMDYAAQILVALGGTPAATTALRHRPVAWAISRLYSSSLTIRGMARQNFSEPGKFQRFGKSRHCCDLTGCMAQFSPSRKMHSPLGLSVRASPRRSWVSRVNCWINSGSVIRLLAASREISASVKRTCPGQRQQAVQR